MKRPVTDNRIIGTDKCKDVLRIKDDDTKAWRVIVYNGRFAFILECYAQVEK